jgi:hypothetical protein
LRGGGRIIPLPPKVDDLEHKRCPVAYLSALAKIGRMKNARRRKIFLKFYFPEYIN